MPNPVSVSDVFSQTGVTVFERGWLSANNVLVRGGSGPTAMIDTGYGSHAAQTLALVGQALGDHELDLLLNTHLHSDHCGGNAALQKQFPAVRTLIPPGLAAAVAAWDEVALTYAPTGQHCPRFHHDGLLLPGTEIVLGPIRWEIHAAKGHDPHSIVLFQPDNRLLVSADALWQNGFGVVFPELEGESAFDEVADTLDLIESLAPTTVIPGHGGVFQEVDAALKRARSRLEQFRAAPDKHLRHAHKVLIKFRLLERQRMDRSELLDWTRATPYLRPSLPQGADSGAWLDQLLHELERSGALRMDGTQVFNS